MSSPPSSSSSLSSSSSRKPHPDFTVRQHQLGQIQTFLQERGILRISPGERRQFFERHPELLAETKVFFERIGLGGKNFAELQRYFQEVGLAFFPSADTPVQPQFYSYHFELSQTQKSTFVDKGFITVNDIVGKEFRDDALRAINSSLGRGFLPERVPSYNAGTWCPELISSPSIMNLLYRTPALAVALSLAGPVANVQYGCIAVRHPGFGCISESDERIRCSDGGMTPLPTWTYWDIDGLTCNLNNGLIRNYTCSLTVFLSPLPSTLSGNITVYSRSHRLLHSHIRNLGGADFAKDIQRVRNQIAMPDPEQICVQPGDILLSHYLTARCDAPNLSPDIRYSVTFNLYHGSHVPNVFRPESLDDLWLEFDGLRDIVQANNLVLLSQMRPCVRCRASIHIESKFCAYCGAPQS